MMLQKISPFSFNKQQVFSQTSEWAKRNWIKMFSLFLVAYVLLHKDLNFQLNLNGTPPHAYQASALPLGESTTPTAMNTSFSNKEEEYDAPIESTPIFKEERTTSSPQKTKDDNLANTYSNMTYSFDANASKKIGARKEENKKITSADL